MQTPIIITTLAYFKFSPMVDSEFDRFECNSEFEVAVRAAEENDFYHDTFNDEE